MEFERRSFWTVAGSLLAVAVISWGCGGSSATTGDSAGMDVPPDVVASYAGTQLTLSEFEDRYAKSTGGLEAAIEDSLAEYEDFLERYVDFRLKVMSAEEAGLDQDSALVAEIDGYRTQLARPYMVEKEVVDDLVADLYEKSKEQVTASHILVRVQGGGAPADTLAAYERMAVLRDSVLAGEDFNDIAFRNSDDPTAKRNRGLLGTFSGGRMILSFEDRAYETAVGEMSDIFSTRYGYHLIFVHDRGPREPEISASHILIRATEEDTASALETVAQVQARLDSGEAFSDVAREFSEDEGSAARGGSLGSFGRGRMVGPFEEAAFALQDVGDRSDWFRTRFGYHIIQLDGIEELPTYDEQYDELKSRAQRLPRFKAAEVALGKEYLETLESSIDTLAIDSLTSGFMADSVLYFLSLHEWTIDELATPIATLGPQVFTLGDFLTYGMENRARRPPAYHRGQMIELVHEMLESKSLDVAAATLEDRDADFADLMREYKDGIVLFRVMEDSVWNAASQDSAGMAGHYAVNADRYRFPERTRIVSFFASSDSLLGIVAEQWMPGSTSDWSIHFEDDARYRVDTTFVADSTNSIYDRALGLAVGESVGPLEYRSGHILLAVDGIEAPRGKTANEARADVLGEYQQILENEWVARLRGRYDARVYPENLVGAFANPAESAEGEASSSE